MKPQAGLALPFYGPRDVATVTRERLEILTDEMASQRTSDPGKALRSDFSEVSRLSSSLQRLDALSESATLAQAWGTNLQASLGQIAAASSRLADSIPATVGTGSGGQVDLLASIGEDVARDIASSLRKTLNGRALFGNGTTQAVALDIETVLSDVDALSAAATGFSDYVAAVDTYFDAAGTFETTQLAWLSVEPAQFEIGEGEQARFQVDAAAQELKDALKQAVLTAGLTNAGFTTLASDELALTLQTRSASVQSSLPLLQGDIGSVEGRVDLVIERLTNDRRDAEVALSDRLSVDPYDTATRLQNELGRLESLYAITARRSQLRLTDYL